MKCRVDLKTWIAGVGFTITETFDNLEEYCSASDYIKSLDDPLDIPPDGDILVEIRDTENNKLSEAWASEVQ